MSYQVLARKYRPRNFGEMVGQEHVLRALINALEQNRLHQAYLFTGTRGVGKTTVARIFAKCLNCETGITSTPCGTCSACLEISEGRSVDLIEVDAASRTRVEDTRDLLENVQYMPAHARFKIYLIDEVHMLSNHSFNALLKTLEEPPEHVKFLLATTAPKKLPATVLSRCLQFNLKNMSPEHIVLNLRNILASEGVEFEEPALWSLARAADGSMRDALSLTDQAISFGQNRIIERDVRAMLGTMEQGEVVELLEALVANDAAAALGRVSEIAAFAPDYGLLLADLLSMLHRVAVAQAVPGGLDNSQGDQAFIESMAGRIAPEMLQLYYQIALIGQRDLALAPDGRSGFEMILLRMLAFQPASRPLAAGSGTQAPPTRVAPMKSGEGTSPRKQAMAAAQAALKSEPRATARKAPAAKREGPAEKPPQTPQASQSAPQTVQASGGMVPAAPPPAILPALGAADWVALQPTLPLRGVTATLAANCGLRRMEQGRVWFQLRDEHASLWNKAHEGRIAAVLSEHLGAPVQVSIEIGSDAIETPAQNQSRERQAEQARAVAAIEGDRNVRALVEEFNGMVARDTIAPRRPGEK